MQTSRVNNQRFIKRFIAIFRKMQTSRVNNQRFIKIKNAKFPGYDF